MDGAQLVQRVDLSNLKPVGTLAIATTPPGAKVSVDGKSRGVAPVTLADLPAGPHTVLLESGDGTVRREVKIVAGAETALNEAIFPGWIAVFAPFDLQIYHGKRLLGSTESGRIMLPPGRYELQLVNAALGVHEARTLTVVPGETAAVTIGAVLGILRITGPAGAEVWIDGERVGETPLGDLRVALGTREILVRHPQLGEQRFTSTVSRSAATELTVDFHKRPDPD